MVSSSKSITSVALILFIDVTESVATAECDVLEVGIVTEAVTTAE